MAQKRNSKTLKGRARQLGKLLAINSGAMGLYHRIRHREALTVLMFHRVLPRDLISRYGADEEYAISTNLLEELISFIAAHYSIVSLADVVRSRHRVAPLPSRPLLITFDDGWNDNAIFAAPVLARMNVPWTLFVATGAPESGEHWWQETLLSAVRSGRANYNVLKAAALHSVRQMSHELPNDRALSLLILYGMLPAIERERLIAVHCEAADYDRPRDMASWETLGKLGESGVAIGAHGISHLPLTFVENPEYEIRHSRAMLEKHLGTDTAIAMSFPHGRYDASLVEVGRRAGMELLFTSDSVLNKCSGGWLEADLLGRISISTADVAGPTGRLQPERLMPWLMSRRQIAMG